MQRTYNHYYPKNTERERKLYQYLDLLKAVAGNQINELFRDQDSSRNFIGEILPDLSDETIDELMTIYLIEEELKRSNTDKLHKSTDLPPIEHATAKI